MELPTGNTFSTRRYGAFTQESQLAIENCRNCAQSCEQLIQYCLNKGGSHADPDHIGLLQDCAEFCNLTSRFLIRKSSLRSKICEIAAEVCLACASDCERFENDEVMQSCAVICRRCSESCQHLISVVH